MHSFLLLSLAVDYPTVEFGAEGYVNSDSGDDNILGAFETLLDHFSSADHRQIRLKYAMNDEFCKAGGPVFFYVDFTDTPIMVVVTFAAAIHTAKTTRKKQRQQTQTNKVRTR